MRPNISAVIHFVVVLLLLGLAGGPRPAQAETIDCQPVTVGSTITAPGIYCLTGDITTNLPFGVAINIEANNVVLDLNGHKLGNLAAGAETEASGIFARNRKDITIKNGTVQGFLIGIHLQDLTDGFATSQGHVIEAVRADRNTQEGMKVMGRGNLIRNNQVVATGGRAVATGILVFGPENRVISNAVIHTFAAGMGTATGIKFFSDAADALAVNNRITQANVGIFFSFGSDGTGKFRDNLTSGVGTPFSHPAGVIDAGGNN